MNELKELGCLLIYGGTEEERQLFKNKYLDMEPDYRFSIHPAFSLTVKSGLFHKEKENKKSVLQILMDDPDIKKLGQDYVVRQLREMDAEFFMHRQMKALSQKQRERVSLLYEVLKGRQRILFCDSDLKEKEYYFHVARWLNQSREFLKNQGKLIWITDLPIAEFFSYPKKLYAADQPVYHLLPKFLPILKLKDGLLHESSDVDEENEAAVQYLADRTQELFSKEELADLLKEFVKE